MIARLHNRSKLCLLGFLYLQELFAKLRPKMKRLATLQEAEERLAKLAATQGSGATAQAKQSAGLGEQQGGQESQQNGAGLAPVIEEGGEEQASDEEGEDGDKEEEDGQEEGQEGEGNEGEKGDRVGRRGRWTPKRRRSLRRSSRH